MTKQKIDGRMIITKTAADFVNDFLSLEEVHITDLQEDCKRMETGYAEMGKQNVKVELFPSEMKIVASFDLAN